MSRTPKAVEDLIVKRFSDLKGAEDFTVSDIEPLIEKLRDFDQKKRDENEKVMQQALTKKRKPTLICRKPECGNDREELFDRDERIGQVTCMVCGTVAIENEIQDKEWVRHFEDDSMNPSFHGAAADPKFSSSRNLETGIAKIPSSNKAARELMLARDQVELNAVRNGVHEKQTRLGYKDQQKDRMFQRMSEVTEAIQLHETILGRAKTIFGRYRDEVEQLRSPFEVCAACMVLAFREKIKQEGEGSVAEGGEVLPEFKCKYCGFTFGLRRDRDWHQKKCDQKPKDGATKEVQ